MGALWKNMHTGINNSLEITISRRRKIDSAHNVTPQCKGKVQQDKRHATTGNHLKTEIQEANIARRMAHKRRKTEITDQMIICPSCRSMAIVRGDGVDIKQNHEC